MSYKKDSMMIEKYFSRVNVNPNGKIIVNAIGSYKITVINSEIVEVNTQYKDYSILMINGDYFCIGRLVRVEKTGKDLYITTD